MSISGGFVKTLCYLPILIESESVSQVHVLTPGRRPGSPPNHVTSVGGRVSMCVSIGVRGWGSFPWFHDDL